jgi:hypothetical protein
LQQRCYTSVCVCDVYKRHKRLCSIAVTKDAPVYSLCFASSLLQSAPCRTSESRRRKKKIKQKSRCWCNIDRNLPGPISPLFVSNA